MTPKEGSLLSGVNGDVYFLPFCFFTSSESIFAFIII